MQPGVKQLELLYKVAIVALVLDVLVILGFLSSLGYWIYQDILFDNINQTLKNKIDTKDYEELDKFCEELLQSKKRIKMYCAYYGLSLTEFKKKNLEMAQEYAEQAIEVIPSLSHAYLQIIQIMLSRKEYLKSYFFALQALNNNVLFDSNFGVHIGMIFLSCKQYIEAIKLFEQSSKKDINSPKPLVCMAIAHYLNKNNQKAIDFIREARKKINPNSAKHFEVNEWAKGLLAIIHGDLKEARYIFEYYRESSNFEPVFEQILDRIKLVIKPD